MSDLTGIINVNKPSGWTSHDVVNKIRNMLGGIKTGHTGTLDPFATGVLVVLTGKATKTAKEFENDDKSYLAEITFGFSTDTYDCTGTTKETGDPSKVDIKALESIIQEMQGEQEQYPPMFSALKVGGKKLYNLARKGIEIERTAKKINLYRIESDLSNYPKIILDLDCSKGTYIRTIADDMGKMAGCPAHLSALKRTVSGRFKINDSCDFAEIALKSDKELLIKCIQKL